MIIGTAEVLLPYSTLEELALILVPMAKHAKVPVVLHFDHGLTLDCVHKAIALGFSSVMYDCSTKSYKENVRDVKAMVEYAHSRGISVEAELGHVGANDGSAEGDGSGDHSIYNGSSRGEGIRGNDGSGRAGGGDRDGARGVQEQAEAGF